MSAKLLEGYPVSSTRLVWRLALILRMVEEDVSWPEGFSDAEMAMILKIAGGATPVVPRPLFGLRASVRLAALAGLVGFGVWVLSSVYRAGDVLVLRTPRPILHWRLRSLGGGVVREERGIPRSAITFFFFVGLLLIRAPWPVLLAVCGLESLHMNLSMCWLFLLLCLGLRLPP